jgi:hypothetical protein
MCSIGGSVGKTTITAHMLCPRLPESKVITVDTSNVTVKHFGIAVDEYSGEEFTQLYKQLVRLDKAIIDVGGSKECKEFLEGMDWMEGHDEVDAFVVPATSDDKSQKAAFKTIELLVAQGVSKDKIKVIFNGVVKNTVVEFDYLLGALSVHQIPFDLEATIFKHTLFDILSVHKRSLGSILTDKTNYKQLFAKSDDDAQLAKLSDLMIAQKAAPKVNENLDIVFNALFPVKKAEAEPKRANAKA